MTPARQWVLWAVGLFAITAVVDVALLSVATHAAHARPAHEASLVISRILGAFLLLGLIASGVFWSRGRRQDAGNRLVGTIAFLIAQGLLFAFMSLATMLGTPHRRWDELTAAHPPAPGTSTHPTKSAAFAIYSCDRFTGAAPASAMRHR